MKCSACISSVFHVRSALSLCRSCCAQTRLPRPGPAPRRVLAEREYAVQETGGAEPVYSFAHTITHEVAYASLPQSGRERLHERVGRVLEEQFDPVRPSKVALRELVYHFVRGSSRDRAAQYLLYAADAGAGIAEDAWAVATYRLA